MIRKSILVIWYETFVWIWIAEELNGCVNDYIITSLYT